MAEIILWKHIKNKVTGYEFHRQVPINEYIVDFYCHELKMAIEVDGCTHDFKHEADEHRQKILENLGIVFVRFTNEDVKKHLSDVLRMLQVRIEEIEDSK
jgi:very-short-patch-repair endonuclease